jgi:hypothetical protein
VLEINLAAILRAGSLLPLRSDELILLHRIVGNNVAERVVQESDAQAVVGLKLAFVLRQDSARVSLVGVILEDRRIEVAIGMQS